ncbi:MAG: hypothetical protein QOD77_1312 [Thermoplasmata archaeon]|nr:hypothetical protein [Thermoplasmata archaeon]
MASNGFESLGLPVILWLAAGVAAFILWVLFIRTFFRMAKALEGIQYSLDGGVGERSVREALVARLVQETRMPAPPRPAWPPRDFIPKNPGEAQAALNVLQQHLDTLER